MTEVVAFPQERLTQIERQGVCKAITEVQAGRATAALTEIRVGLAGEAGLAFGHRFDHEPGFLDEYGKPVFTADEFLTWVAASADR